MSSSVGFPEEDAVTVGTSATQLVTSLDRDTFQLTFVALNTNVNDVFLGSSAVTASGANRGLRMEPGDVAHILINGQGAKEFWCIVAAGTETINVTQVR